MTTTLEQALAYTIATGRRVFFVAATPKTPLKGSHGHLDASADVDTIMGMYPKGTACRWAWRPNDDEVVVDTDPQNGYVEGAVELPPTETYGPTPHGGSHRVYALNGFAGVHSGADVLKSAGIRGVDLKTESGWLVGYFAHSNGLARVAAPPWVGTAQSSAASGKRFELPDIIATGAIDNTLMRAAMSLRATGYSETEIIEMLAVVNRRAPGSTHAHKDFERIARSAAGKPRGELPGRITHGAVDTDEDDAAATPVSLPDFPTHLLPPVMRRHVESESSRLRIPAGIIATADILVAAGAIGGARRVRTDDRTKPVSLYAAIVAPVGGGKSPGIDTAVAPLLEAHRKRSELRIQQLEQRRQWDQTKPTERTEVRPVLVPPLMATDLTYESLVSLLTQADSMFVHPGELTTWVNGLDLYRPGSRGVDRGRFINLYDGNPIDVERKTVDPIIVNDPVVCILGGLQPTLLPALNSAADGLAPRILFNFYPHLGMQYIARELPDQTVLADWKAAIDGLIRLEAGGVGRALPMTPEALDAWRNGHDRAVDVCRAGGPGYIYAKLTDHAARIALVLAVFENPRATVVDVESVDAAWALCLDFFAHHARAALALAPAAASQDPLVRWLERHGGKATLREVKRAKIPGIHDLADVEQREVAGLVRIERRTPTTGGPETISVSLP